MSCWKCGEKLEFSGKVPFRATCDKCQAWQHCCRNCKHYKPGRANDCEVPDTEYVADREGMNLCEDFSLLGIQQKKKSTSCFDDLFK